MNVNNSKVIEEVLEEVKLEQVQLIEDAHNYSHISIRSASKQQQPSAVLQDLSNQYVNTQEKESSLKKQVRFDSPQAVPANDGTHATPANGSHATPANGTHATPQAANANGSENTPAVGASVIEVHAHGEIPQSSAVKESPAAPS